MKQKSLRLFNFFMDGKIFKLVIKLLFLFFLSFIISYLFSNNEIEPEIFTLQTEITYNYLNSAIFIIINNSIVMFLILSGLILGEWVVYLICITNGISIGIIVSKIPIVILLTGMLPHGFLEISCFALMGSLVIIKLREIKIVTVNHFLVPFIGIIIASFIEVVITPWLLLFII